MQKKHHLMTFAAGTALALLAGTWAVAQTTEAPPVSTVPPPAAKPGTSPGGAKMPTVPLTNPLNRNPSRRALVPDNTPPPPPDPRDSSVRPVMPPGSVDSSRDTVLPPPAPPASDVRSP